MCVRLCPGERHRPEPRDVLGAERPPHTHPEGQENGAEEPLQRANQPTLRQNQAVSTNGEGAEWDVITPTHVLTL